MRVDTNVGRIDSEIALTALLAAGVTGFPTPSLSLYPYIKLVAIGLLALTLVKRMGVLNGLTREDTSLLVLTHVMDPATHIAAFYLCYIAAKSGQRLVPFDASPITFPLAFSVAVIVLVFAILLAFELVFSGLLREGERIFAASAEQHRGEAFGELLRNISNQIAQSDGTDSTWQSELTNSRHYDHSFGDLSEEQVWYAVRSFAIMIASIFFVLLVHVVLLLVGAWAFEISWWLSSILLFSVLVVSAYSRMWYSNYGLIPAEERNGYATFAGDAVTYAFVGLLVL